MCLEYFTSFRQLGVLELGYLTGKSIDKPLPLKLVDLCPKLEKITMLDGPSGRRARDFAKTAVGDVFPVATELPSYFESKIIKRDMGIPDVVIEYVVRVDRLRQDIARFQQLITQFGRLMVRRFFGRY